MFLSCKWIIDSATVVGSKCHPSHFSANNYNDITPGLWPTSCKMPHKQSPRGQTLMFYCLYIIYVVSLFCRHHCSRCSACFGVFGARFRSLNSRLFSTYSLAQECDWQGWSRADCRWYATGVTRRCSWFLWRCIACVPYSSCCESNLRK